MSHTFKCVLPIIIGLIVYGLQFVVGLPDGITPNQWLYFSIFMGVIVGLILEPIPAALIGLMGIVVAVLCKVGPKGSGALDAKITSAAAIKWGLEGFSNTIIWLIFAAFMIGIGYSKSGLGKRIALILVSRLGKTTLGLGYAIAIVDGILAPFIPSNAARSGGTLYPIISSIPEMFGSKPNDPSTRKIGAYLAWTALATTCVSSSIFLTGQAPNALAVNVAAQSGVHAPSWGGWFIALLPVSVITFLLTPYLAYKIYPPEIKKAEDVATWAASELSKLGGITKKEIAMGLISLGGLVLWVGAKQFGVNATTTAIMVIIAMILTGILKWDDILSNKPAWNVLVWFGTLVTLAGGLNNTGFLKYLGGVFSGALGSIEPLYAIVGLILIFYYIHYFFASGTAHVTALLGVFIAIASGISGYDASVITLLILLPMGFMGVLTPYGTGHSPLWFASGYIPTSDFWRLGAIFGTIYMIIYLVVGLPWVLFVAKDFAF
ncbi:DASS family sodium-coupled anion symporter [Campylobacter sp. 19-13652]|uniref:DASS family sodium-coupled anion symporter n=1 Tax=Campylobacter sp. 19-13652 TaxID=2840180 RepID=UPI001C795AFD|nr:DASS family sodium-coupled anion symporter [Campylobacter sp. 19-13652]BCX79623.1 ABC transporter permease [Campylobacter sp. 19-13652]